MKSCDFDNYRRVNVPVRPDKKIQVAIADILALEKIRQIVDSGKSAEVKKMADGSLKVYKVSKECIKCEKNI